MIVVMVTLARAICWTNLFGHWHIINASNVEYSVTHQTTLIEQVSRGYCLLNVLYRCANVAREKVRQDQWRMCTGNISGGCVQEISGGCVQEVSVADVYRKYQWKTCTGSIVAAVYRKYQWRKCTGSVSGGCVQEIQWRMCTGSIVTDVYRKY